MRRLLGVRTGVARVIHSILMEWQRLPMPFDEVRLLSPRPLPAGLIPPHPRFREVVVGPDVPGLLWEQVVLPARVRDLDVFLAPSDTMPVMAPWKRVVMMYAYSPEMAASFPWSARIRWEPFARNAARNGDAIIVSSRNILETLELGLGVHVPRERVHYAPLAADARFHPRPPDDPELSSALSRYGVADAPYILFVGKLSRRRHIPELLAAFREVSAEVPHRLLRAPESHLEMRIAHQRHRVPWRRGRRRDEHRIERPRTDRPIDTEPCGRRIAVVHVRRRPVESFPPDLPLECFESPDSL